MEKKHSLKHIAWSLLRSKLLSLILKSVTGPYGWVVKWLAPVLLDRILKPLYLKSSQKMNKIINKVKAKKKVRRMNDAETADDYLNTLNK